MKVSGRIRIYIPVVKDTLFNTDAIDSKKINHASTFRHYFFVGTRFTKYAHFILEKSTNADECSSILRSRSVVFV